MRHIEFRQASTWYGGDSAAGSLECGDLASRRPAGRKMGWLTQLVSKTRILGACWAAAAAPRRRVAALQKVVGWGITSFVLTAALLLTAGPAHARVIGRTAEISVGREVASQVEQAYQCDVNPAEVARVRQIGRRLASSAIDTEFPYEFHVVEAPDVNAFALPGGFVYVFRGLLQLIPNDDALAFVLSHEISHVTGHHSIRQFEKNFALNAIITGALIGTGAGANAQNAAGVVQELTGLAFTRHDEADADKNGMELLVRAGYDPRAAAESMMLIKRAAGDDKGTPALLRSHPAPDSRIKTLTKMADDLSARRQTQRTELVKKVPLLPVVEAPDRRVDLHGVQPAACPWMPLVPNTRWVYRSKSEAGEGTVTVRVLERATGDLAPACRVEYVLSRGIQTTRWLVPAADRLLSRAEKPGAAEPWRLDALFADGKAEEGLHCGPLEKVKVPAGEFEARRVERLDGDGKAVSTSWYARGVGLVKRTNRETGVTEELTSYHIPLEIMHTPATTVGP